MFFNMSVLIIIIISLFYFFVKVSKNVAFRICTNRIVCYN